jgi:undecaprenyl-diphosphatase
MRRTAVSRLWALIRKLGWFYGITLALSAIALWAFTEVAEEAIEHETLALNRRILLAIHGHVNPLGDAAALALAEIGSLVGIMLVGAVFAGWLYRRGRLLDVLTLVATLSGGAVLTFVLKSAYRHARPDLFPRLVDEVTYSFPSGHASMSLCLYGFIGGWLIAQGPREPWRWGVGALCLGFALAIGLSRLYLGVHWPTDVVAGWAIAAFWLAVCLAGREWLARRWASAAP